ncbi:MAG TPA: FAD:protein FMN transferase [Gaiellaceae bacterium]|nr:FAD:protein FMN transferase [Gaiellaceae bacterium]
MQPTLTRHRFRAMGTDVELLVEAGGAAAGTLAAAEGEFHRLEALLTRFRPESELSQLNASGSLAAGPDLLRVVELALAARERTGGRFDVRVHDALLAAGYDRSFEVLSPDDESPVEPAAGPQGRIEIADGVISLHGGVRIDLGGIGKGYACERAAEILATAGPCLVNAGGDIATRDGVWTVAVEAPDGPLALELSGSCALATSGRDSRRWRRAGRELHHIIDPATGEPSGSDLLRVTVVARDAVDAEVTAKALFLAGSEAARREADELSIPAVLVTAAGRTITAGGLA